MTKEYLLSQTLYGVGIMNYLILKEFPEHRIFVRGDDCGENPDPVFADGTFTFICHAQQDCCRQIGYRLAQANPHATDYRPTLTWNKVSCGQYPPLCSGYSPCLIYDAR